MELLVVDCDGVLTDGKLYFGTGGEMMKAFSVLDGYGLDQWRRAGHEAAIITGRTSPIASARANELGIHHFRDAIPDKAAALDDLMEVTGFSAGQIAFVGDDLPDLGALKRAGFPVAVANARPELRAVASYITQAEGGFGAVREVTDLLLYSKS